MKRKALVIIITIGLFSLLIGGMELYYYVDNTEFLEEVNNMKSEFAIQTLVEHKVLEKENSTVHYFVSGKPEGQTILFLHPAFSDHSCFDRQIDYFSSEYRIITVDMLGHGLTNKSNSKDKITMMSPYIAEILDAEQIEKIHVVGVSLGALIAQDFALKFPQRILSLTGLGGYNINKEQKEIFKAQRNEVFKWLFKMIFSMTAFRKYIAECSVIGKNEQAHIYESSKNFSRSSFSVMRGMDGLIASRPNIEYPYPLLILAGEKDIPPAVTAAKSWHQDIPTSQFEIIQNAGHCANLDNALEFNKRLMSFLQLKNSEN